MLKIIVKTAVITIFMLIFSNDSQARTFSNAYISFELQDNWNCKLEQTEWVCRAEDPQEAKEAVIILTAKEVGPSDTFPIYESHMNTPIKTTTKTGVSLTSIIKYKAQTQKINDQSWLDGLHQDSEVQNYFTRYVGTIKENIAILVTFSAHNKLYSKYSGNFDKAIRSLRIVATKDFLKMPDRGVVRGSGEIFDTINVHIEGTTIADENPEFQNKSIFKNYMFLGMLLLILAALLYFGVKIYKKKK